ncbi:hypothetical protein HHI36_010497 [Cryptolaemus montrouzieri]|uniref:Uncharacterized protein n=1 Tax=Cryptolaemus montrouzieri TaxID=559131 RepID=A0ABD2MIW7_9CUCU
MGCRQGNPEQLYSHNRKNFRGGEREITQCLEELNKEILHGGCWERIIQSVKNSKRAFHVTTSTRTYNADVFVRRRKHNQFMTTDHVSLDPDFEEALTPNHFLIGPRHAARALTKTTEKDLNLLSSGEPLKDCQTYFGQGEHKNIHQPWLNVPNGTVNRRQYSKEMFC